MLPKLTDTTQTICFSETDGVCSTEVYASDVMVTTTAGNHNHGSSKVKLKNLVDYNWELKFYPGQLLAVHMSGKYLAYAIKAPNTVNSGSWNGMVRVVYTPEPGSDRRALIKGMKGEIQDLSFAHIQNEVVLAFIDEFGNFYVHKIEATDSGLRCTQIAEVHDDSDVAGTHHRVVWCPYIPDDDDSPDDNVAKLLLTTHAKTARMWSMSGVEGSPGRREAAVCCAGVLDAAFSPDGTALATAASDGYVMFYQVYMSSSSPPRCLHKWQPHGGQALSSLFFLDNHKTYSTDVQFWKFAVTGAENNTVIKIWSCKSWSCLQTIRLPQPDSDSSGLKAALDSSARYLILSNFRARTLYVLHMARDRDETMAYCKSITEFLLPYPVLSFAILDADEEGVKCESSCDDPYHRNGSADEEKSEPDEFDIINNEEDGIDVSIAPCTRRTRLRLYLVQPKGLQEGELVYTPPPPQALQLALGELSLSESANDSTVSSILQQQSQQLKNLVMRSQTQPGSLMQRAESPPAPLNLMTPDAFSSPGKRDEDDPPLSATPDIANTNVKQRGSTSGVVEEPVVCKMTSGGSSPSREVQEIMAHNDKLYYKEEMDEGEESSQTPVVEDIPLAVCNGDDDPDMYVNADVYTGDLPDPPDTDNLTNSSETNWPQISIAQITEANHRKATSDKSVNQSLNQSVNQSTSQAGNDIQIVCNNISTARLDALENKLDKLYELMVSQRTELSRELSEPLDALREEVTRDTRHAVRDALSDGWERISSHGEAASRAAAAAAGLGAARALEPLAAALQHELAAKLSATDTLLRDNIAKLVNSKAVLEALSSSIASRISEAVQAAFRTSLAELVLPAVEKAHHQMYKQLNHTFQQGTKEYLSATENATRLAVERGAAGASNALLSALQRHSELLEHQLPPNQRLQQIIQDATHSVVEKELSWLREQTSRVPSPATPASAVTAHSRQMQVAQIQSLLGAGDLNGAFQLALSASDLALVMCACKGADPQMVFAPPCKLRQNVLLSLIQQLAADMTRDTALKHKYLEEAIMNLDTSNPVTREHLPNVLRELQKQLAGFLSSNLGHQLTKQFRMLLMITESLLKTSV